MSNNIQVRIEWTLNDLLNAVKAIRTKRRFANNLNYFTAFVLALLGIGMLLLGALQEPVFGFVTFVCWTMVLCLATGGLQSQLQARRAFKKNPERFVPCEVTIDDEGFREKSSTVDVRIPWSTVTNVEENEHTFILKLSTKEQMILPKRVFSSGEVTTARQIFSQYVQVSSSKQ